MPTWGRKHGLYPSPPSSSASFEVSTLRAGWRGELAPERAIWSMSGNICKCLCHLHKLLVLPSIHVARYACASCECRIRFNEPESIHFSMVGPSSSSRVLFASSKVFLLSGCCAWPPCESSELSSMVCECKSTSTGGVTIPGEGASVVIPQSMNAIAVNPWKQSPHTAKIRPHAQVPGSEKSFWPGFVILRVRLSS